MPPREGNQSQSKADGAHVGQVVRDAEGMPLRTITVGDLGVGQPGKKSAPAKGAAGSNAPRQDGARQVWRMARQTLLRAVIRGVVTCWGGGQRLGAEGSAGQVDCLPTQGTEFSVWKALAARRLSETMLEDSLWNTDSCCNLLMAFLKKTLTVYKLILMTVIIYSAYRFFSITSLTWCLFSSQTQNVCPLVKKKNG